MHQVIRETGGGCMQRESNGELVGKLLVIRGASDEII